MSRRIWKRGRKVSVDVVEGSNIGNSIGSLQPGVTVITEHTIHWKRIVESNYEPALISTVDQTTLYVYEHLQELGG